MLQIPIFDASGQEVKIILADFKKQINKENYPKYCENIYKIVNSDQHLEISNLAETDFGKRSDIFELKIKTKSGYLSPLSIFLGSIIDGKNSNLKHLYFNKKIIKSIIYECFYNIKNNNINGIDLFDNKFESQYIYDLFEVIYWIALEDSTKKLNNSLYICEKNNINFFTNYKSFYKYKNENLYLEDKLNQAYVFAKYFLSYKENPLEFQTTSFIGVKRDFFEIIQSLKKQKISCKKKGNEVEFGKIRVKRVGKKCN